MFEPRTYRKRVHAEGLAAFRVVVDETDLHIQVGRADASPELAEHQKPVALEAVKQARKMIAAEIALRRDFATSFDPLPARNGAPELVAGMYAAAEKAGTGPMAAVAGAVSEWVGKRLLEECDEVIVENGGDIFMSTRERRTIAIYAGRSPLSNRTGLVIPAGQKLGICTSSGTVGHSYSEGKADAALIVADDTSFADAVATALGNRVSGPEDVEQAINWASHLDGVRHALIITGAAMGVWGEFEIARIST